MYFTNSKVYVMYNYKNDKGYGFFEKRIYFL